MVGERLQPLSQAALRVYAAAYHPCRDEEQHGEEDGVLDDDASLREKS